MKHEIRILKGQSLEIDGVKLTAIRGGKVTQGSNPPEEFFVIEVESVGEPKPIQKGGRDMPIRNKEPKKATKKVAKKATKKTAVPTKKTEAGNNPAPSTETESDK